MELLDRDCLATLLVLLVTEDDCVVLAWLPQDPNINEMVSNATKA
ncbi:hypothetical protein PLO_1568 [Pediococcus acidilactici NGRI 0510Q]|nr:hypothetical protein PLO_1568 [Pediococcus acidilactici NGRI 0510Q]